MQIVVRKSYILQLAWQVSPKKGCVPSPVLLLNGIYKLENFYDGGLYSLKILSNADPQISPATTTPKYILADVSPLILKKLHLF